MARLTILVVLFVCCMAHALKPIDGAVKELGEGDGVGAQLQQKLAAEQARSAELVKQLQKLKTVAQDHTDNLRKRLDAERSERMKLQDKLGLPHEEPLGEGDQWGFSNPMVAQGSFSLLHPVYEERVAELGEVLGVPVVASDPNHVTRNLREAKITDHLFEGEETALLEEAEEKDSHGYQSTPGYPGTSDGANYMNYPGGSYGKSGGASGSGAGSGAGSGKGSGKSVYMAGSGDGPVITPISNSKGQTKDSFQSCDWVAEYTKSGNDEKMSNMDYDDNGDHVDCTKHNTGPIACTDSSHEKFEWAKTNCKMMCNQQCNPYASECPNDLMYYIDHSRCKPEFCLITGNATKAEMQKFHWAQHNCRKMCDPSCNPKTKHISFGLPTYVPGATLQPGHRHCKDKLNVETQYGDTKNHAFKDTTKVPVCGKCSSDEYMLHPAFSVGNRIVGVCEKTTDHWLWQSLGQECNNQSMPCHGEVSSQCEKFMAGFGEYDGHQRGEVEVTHPNQMDKQKPNTGIAFTCSRLYAFDHSASQARAYRSTSEDGGTQYKCSGTIYRLVQAKFVACHSTNEYKLAKQSMSCVNRKELKSCQYKVLQFNDYEPNEGDPENIQEQHLEHCNEEFNDQARTDAFEDLNENGIGETWKPCSELDEKTITAMG